MAYAYKANEKDAFLEKQRAVYEERINENGSVGYHLLYTYWDFYKLDLESETLTKLESKNENEKFEFDFC